MSKKQDSALKKKAPFWLENYYIVGVVSFITVSIFMSYFVFSDLMDIMPLRVIRYVILASMLVKIVFFDVKFYSKKRLIVTVISFLIMLLSAFYSDTRNLLWIFIMVIAAYRTDFKRVLRYVLISELLIVCLIVLLYVLQITPDRVYGRSGSDVIRHSLGFRYATYLGLFLFSIACGWFYLRWKAAKWFEFLIFVGLSAIVYLLTDSRFEPFCTLIVVGYFGLRRLYPELKFEKTMAFLSKYGVLLAAVFSLVVVIFYNGENPVLDKINSISSNRLSLMNGAVMENGISLLGEPIQWVSISEVYSGEADAASFNAVDNVYVRLILNYGILVLGLFLTMQYLLGKKAVNEKNLELQFILVLIAFYSILSPRMVELTFNYFLMLYPTIELLENNQVQKKRNEKK